ncbi:Tho complex subunit 7-domain-containing protein [Mycena floridula]|nr:Tho complex subunit 7-domain-containing protein [Mycena floridula]
MSAQNPIVIPPLTVEEEDQIVLARITHEERPLRRVIKKFHAYASLWTANDPELDTNVRDARESFLVELSTFQLTLQKSSMICEAEARQIEEYERERQRLNDEYGVLRGQIEQLKTSLEHAQVARRQKMEYDLITEKINTLPSRAELERGIEDLDNDMAAIRAEHETQSRVIQSQKSSLDTIISDLQAMRFIGKDKDAMEESSVAVSSNATPAPEGSAGDNAEPLIELSEEKEEGEEKEDGEEEEEENVSETGEVIETANEDDIEMGELEEDVKDFKGKKKPRDDMEEGEATDASSELSDPPDDV